MSASPQKSRTRLSPEVRQKMILDHAAQLISVEGVSGINMEQLGRAVGVSKSLIYSYFPSLNDLLWALLKREYTELRRRQLAAAETANTLEQLVRRVTNTYLLYIEERGILLERLAAEPSVMRPSDPTMYGRQPAVGYFTEIISKTLGIDPKIAAPAVDISFGLPAAAGHYLTNHDIDRQTVEDITVTMILGAIEAIGKNYTLTFKPLKK